MTNYTYKSKDERKRGVLSPLKRFLHIEGSYKEEIHVRFMSQILFVSMLCLLYIGNRHYAEKVVRNISKLEREVEDLRADYTTLKSDYMFASKQAEISRRVARLGLSENKRSPQKIFMLK